MNKARRNIIITYSAAILSLVELLPVVGQTTNTSTTLRQTTLRLPFDESRGKRSVQANNTSATLRRVSGQALSASKQQTTNNQQPTTNLIVVNSNQDAYVADEGLTLREAISLANGALSLEELSETERGQVTLVRGATRTAIEFDLLPPNTTIELTKILPPLAAPGLIIDGTTNPGYDMSKSAIAEIPLPFPVVSITVAEGKQIFRGLTVVADDVVIKGLSIYGFNKSHGKTATTPPGDIFIANRKKIWGQEQPEGQLPPNTPPRNVIIENNWLGITPEEKMPNMRSAFGVSLFNSVGTVIRGNWIANHDGSGIITGVLAENFSIQDNIIVGNGIAGTPDNIHLEGEIDRGIIEGNLLCAGDGAGIYLFKTEGAIEVRNNTIKYNGRRLRRAAIYLMGNNHRVVDNTISNQTGPGVVVAAYPKSRGNIIENNRFGQLQGLSIDLNTRDHVRFRDWQVGDGPNPKRNSENRRRDTGNGAINAPEFLSSEFFIINDRVVIDGIADAGATIAIYQVGEEESEERGPLSEPLAVVRADEEGRFGAKLAGLEPEDLVSAIATQEKYGTSEPAINARVMSLDRQVNGVRKEEPWEMPRCTNPPAPQDSPPTTIPRRIEGDFLPPPTAIPRRIEGDFLPEVGVAPTPIRLKVPRNIHFALDKSNISSASSVILDQIAGVLNKYPFIVIELEGHTDTRGSNEYNIALARRRALAARNYLLRQGVEPERMRIRTVGESEVKTPGNTIVDHARNRRVEAIFRDLRGIDIILEDQEGDLQLERP